MPFFRSWLRASLSGNEWGWQGMFPLPARVLAYVLGLALLPMIFIRFHPEVPSVKWVILVSLVFGAGVAAACVVRAGRASDAPAGRRVKLFFAGSFLFFFLAACHLVFTIPMVLTGIYGKEETLVGVVVGRSSGHARRGCDNWVRVELPQYSHPRKECVSERALATLPVGAKVALRVRRTRLGYFQHSVHPLG